MEFPKNISEIIQSSTNYNANIFANLWQQKQLPENGWSDSQLRQFMCWLSNLDSNNTKLRDSIGAGEREGRVCCPLVSQLHFDMSHGIGRSGSLCEVQPKALGSSMMAEIANGLALKVINELGVPSCKAALVTPLATGMSMMLVLASWRQRNPKATHVIWSRIDQKSCFKCILAAGLTPIVIEPKLMGTSGSSQLATDIAEIEKAVEQYGDKILCVISTTSCFSPRQPDDLEGIAKICATRNIRHLVNNAYGLQSKICCDLLEKARIAGRVDCFVQSTDKNFQVPVGGAIIATFKLSALKAVANIYPGRASAVPVRDLLLTLLHLGKSGVKEIIQTREKLFHVLRQKMESLANKLNERIIEAPNNLISIAMTLETIPVERCSLFGSILFHKGVTGARVIVPSNEETTIEGYCFKSFGCHSSHWTTRYLNVACAVGMTEYQIDELVKRIETVYFELLKKLSKE
ncbi:o-phosphoseryl-tRNA(Sec) selenium transferase, sepSecS domain-containing protein [Ditylenchus destructor]|uniref:O-phosphoseryl-tRNA(Sec) selenium transferase n=1 Tax=Ditylenchus destructor TaxID=166010 RepID=A0AAD4NFT0_9BILA|nr:o-phosphoseryl-tRNA(Sec) selenium transferase, sepSecS domain-containing protein [Ditylenchus destructor]